MPKSDQNIFDSSEIADEVDLIGICKVLIVKWKIVLITAVLFGIISTGYGFLIPPSYDAEVLILPSSTKDLGSINLARMGIGRTDPRDIYDIVRLNLGSRNFQQNFLEKATVDILKSNEKLIYLKSSPDGFSIKTRNAMSMEIAWQYGDALPVPALSFLSPADLQIGVTSDKTSNRPYLVVDVKWRNPQEAAQLANEFVRFVDKETVSDIARETRDGIEVRKKNIQTFIEYKRSLARKIRNDLVVQLTEAAALARALGFSDPIDSLSKSTVIYVTPPPQFFRNSTSEPETIYEWPERQRILPLYQPKALSGRNQEGLIEGNTPPLYARGWRALEAEAAYLATRTSDDSYIEELRDLQQELAWLKEVSIDEKNSHVLTIDVPATPPSHPKRSRTFFLAIGTTSGLLFGCVLALAIYFFQLRNRKTLL